jgi:hypothetical protein
MEESGSRKHGILKDYAASPEVSDPQRWPAGHLPALWLDVGTVHEPTAEAVCQPRLSVTLLEYPSARRPPAMTLDTADVIQSGTPSHDAAWG